ncbi:MAG: SpoIIE family protein phosphatase [Candidatus Riflebacteria bacterium]|nr:SpoIIE family protein phosphatase [Candidatus Riflebacteria bacterium]
MKSTDSRYAYLLILLLGVALNLLLIDFLQERCELREQQTCRRNSEAFLEKLYTSFKFETIFNQKFRTLFADIAGKTVGEAAKLSADWLHSRGLASDAVEIVYFTDKQPLNVATDTVADWKFMLSRFDTGLIRSRAEGEIKNRIVKLLNGGVGFPRLEAKPGEIQQVSIARERTYGVWFSDPQSFNTGINAMIVFIHNKGLNDRLLAKNLFASVGISEREFGYVNLFNPEDSLVPEGLNPYVIVSRVSSMDIKSGCEYLSIGGHEVLAVFKPDGRILLAVMNYKKVPIPFWSWALFFFWLPVWARISQTAQADFRLSLTSLISFVFVISMALPVMAVGFYWNLFLDSRRESARIETAGRLEKLLIQLDTSYAEIFRTTRKEYVNLVNIMNGKPENLQEFIDESVRLELKFLFDTCLLIDGEGRFVRPYAGAGIQVRRLVFFDKAHRERVVRQAYADGWIPFDLEAEYISKGTPENFDINEFVSLMPIQGKTAYTSIMSFTGKDLINRYNNALMGAGTVDKEEVSSMIMSSFLDTEDESSVARIQQNLGDFIEIGFDVNQSINFVDLIKDRQGKAIYCLIMFSGNFNFSRNYFEKVFADKGKWPAEISYFAVSPRLFNISFPAVDMRMRMQRVVSMMQPPRNLHVEEHLINGKPHLLCAYVGKKVPSYIFCAAMPMDAIEKQLLPLENRLFIAAFIVFIALIFVYVRLVRGVIRPAKLIMNGVRAMESHDHSHKIVIETGDEWQKLAETFNSALEGMKELEVAHFVQTCILPSADICSAGACFSGRTVPADDVGGDYYDAFVPADGEMVFVMGDVSGHSISAALVVSMARAAFSCIVDSGVKKPQEIFTLMNSLMLENLRRVKMMTCFGGYIDKTGLLTCSNAGQAFPYLINEDGSVEPIKQIGYPLGAAKKISLKSSQFLLPDRCRLVMFSDGVVEAMNEDDQPFGYERLERLVKRLGRHCSNEEFFAIVYNEVRKFSGTVPWGDDVTVAILDYDRSKS